MKDLENIDISCISLESCLRIQDPGSGELFKGSAFGVPSKGVGSGFLSKGPEFEVLSKDPGARSRVLPLIRPGQIYGQE